MSNPTQNPADLKRLDELGKLNAISRAMAVIEFDLDGNVTEANDNFLNALGYRRDEIIGRHHRMFLRPDEAASEGYRTFWRELAAGRFQAGEYLRIGKGGREVWIQATYNPILDPEGRAFKVVKFATDITAQKAASNNEARLQAQVVAAKRFQGALDGATTNVMIANENFEIVYMNASLMQMLRKAESAIQTQIPSFRADGLIGSSIDRFHRSPSHQRNLLSNLHGNHKVQLSLGGRYFDLTASASREGDKVVGYSVEWSDTTDAVLAQKEIERVLTGAVDGDLTQRIASDKFTGFLRSISDNTNRLLDSVGDSFRTTKVAIEQIGQAAGQLQTTSRMMSSSAVQLRRASDESSAAVARTATGVKANAESAAMANQLVAQTSTAAQTGQGRMGDMTSAMSEINSSAQRIAKIIKVIDEIAFQTNLLALNAAVEAARAGRHGKGFAVVAQEVRNLAERSAKAAKETADLIEDSVAKVGQGVVIADATRAALSEITGNVVKVVDLAGEIAAASGEQSRMLDAVSKSMTEVTEGAQAGSQQSDEVAAAAEELGRQMDVLRTRMERYKVANVVATALPSGLQGLPPELLAQLLAMVQGQGGQAGSPSAPRPAPVAAANGPDPRHVMPLDRDERGFKGF